VKTWAAPLGAAGLGASVWAAAHARSDAVRHWSPPTVDGSDLGTLYARSSGAGGSSTVLLHGLVATGDIFGACFDKIANRGRLVVPDLLGFGRSLDESRVRFGVEDHLDALDEMMTAVGAGDDSIVIGAHSMGSSLALHWAKRHPARVKRIVCWGAPMYADDAELHDTISESGPMARLFVEGTRWAELACRVSCRHRVAAGWAAAAIQPSLPVPVARAVPLHTWPAYRDAMSHLVESTDWRGLVSSVSQQAEIRFVWGSDDPVGSPLYARSLSGSSVEVTRGADHRLPLTHGPLCVSQLA
jgi:pimeloyl-ACP methyl ester carboxylesterase